MPVIVKDKQSLSRIIFITYARTVILFMIVPPAFVTELVWVMLSLRQEMGSLTGINDMQVNE